MFSRFNSDGSGSTSPTGSSNNNNNLNNRAASFLKMALNQAQQFTSNSPSPRPQDTLKKITDELAANDKLLHTKTPELETMVQPGDEDEEETTADPRDIISGIDISKLTPELRSKMKKFGKYEQKYPILLDAYKTEKMKNSLLENFEKLLQEYTPCSKISESEILIQYLKDLKHKNDLMNEELKKNVGELNGSKLKLKSLELDNSKYQTIIKNMNNNNDSRLKEFETSLKEKDDKILEFEISLKEKDDKILEFEISLKEKDEKVQEIEISKEEVEEEEKPDNLSKSAKKRNKQKKKKQATERQDQSQEQDDLKKQLALANEEIEHLRDSLRDVGNELVELKQGDHENEKTLHLQHTELITTYEKNVKSMKDEILKLEAQIKTLETKNESLEKERQNQVKRNGEDNGLKLQVNNLNKDVELKDIKIQELNSKMKFLEEEKNSINEKYIDLKIQIESFKNQLRQTNEQNNKTMIENENLKEDLKQLNLKIGKLNNENSVLVKNRDELRDKMSDLTKLKSNNSDQANRLLKENEELNMRLREMTHSFETIQEELNDARTMLQERTRETTTIRKLLVELEDEKEKLLKEFEIKSLSKNDEIDKLNFEIGKLNKKNKQEMNELNLQISHLRDELAKGVSTQRKEEEAPIIVKSDDELLNNKVLTLQKQLAITTSNLKEMEKLNQILKKLNDENSLKFEKLNKVYRLQQNELKFLQNESIELKKLKPIIKKDPVKKDDDDEDKISYIKNVLIGFIEKKEQRMNLLPVIKMVLHLTDHDINILYSNLK